TWPAFGSGSGISRMTSTSGPPNAVLRIARMACPPGPCVSRSRRCEVGGCCRIGRARLLPSHRPREKPARQEPRPPGPLMLQQPLILKLGSPRSQCPVEVDGRADEREMRERLREVPQGLAAWPGLLGV